MTAHDTAVPHGAALDSVSDDSDESAPSTPVQRRVVRVSRVTVAAAYAQANLLTSLGEPVPPAVAKIAALARPFPSRRGTDVTAP